MQRSRVRRVRVSSTHNSSKGVGRNSFFIWPGVLLLLRLRLLFAEPFFYVECFDPIIPFHEVLRLYILQFCGLRVEILDFFRFSPLCNLIAAGYTAGVSCAILVEPFDLFPATVHQAIFTPQTKRLRPKRRKFSTKTLLKLRPPFSCRNVYEVNLLEEIISSKSRLLRR